MSDWDKPLASAGWGSTSGREPEVLNTQQQPRRNDYWGESQVAEIPSIPSGGAEPLATSDGPSTMHVHHEVTDLSRLNQQATLPTQPEAGINLSLLTSVVKPANQVYEMNENWDHNQLMIEVSHIIENELPS